MAKMSKALVAAATVSALATGGANAQQVFPTDVIVQGSLCVGFDCVSGESFGFDTIRLKENNLRIHFDDTSSSGSFPRNDWRLVANDTGNGGASYFAIEDATAGNRPFTVTAGAGANAIFVSSSGNVGIGEGAPVVELHVQDGDSPALRLEQDGSSGFTAQTWDLAGNEANFFVRDVTNGSKLPFKIKPGAPTSALFVAASGDIGMGTETVDGALHIKRSSNAYFTLENTANGRRWYFTHENSSPNRFIISRDDAGPEGFFLGADGSLRVGGNGSAGNGLALDATGNLAIGGALTQNSDKNSKMAIIPVDQEAILAKVAALPVSAWTYKHDADSGIRHIGPMAQDFYAAFGTGRDEKGISTIDAAGVALASIKAINSRLGELENTKKQLATLKEENQDLRDKIAQMDQSLRALAGEPATAAE